MRLFGFIFVLATTISGVALADADNIEHLEPLGGNGIQVFAGAEPFFERINFGEMSDMLGVVVWPSFQPASYIFLLKDDDHEEYYIVHSLNTKPNITDYRFRISERLANAVTKSFIGILKTTRYRNRGEDRIEGLDGTTYVFFADGYYGQTWSPRPNTNPGKMVSIFNQLVGIANGKSVNIENTTDEIINLCSSLSPK